MSATLTVYFDGACPLCRREIAFYRRRSGAERIRWVNVGRADASFLGHDLCRDAALERFHVRRADGSLVSGARAFAALWQALPGFRLLGRFTALPVVAPLAELAYRTFLRIRPVLQRRTAYRAAWRRIGFGHAAQRGRPTDRQPCARGCAS